MENAPILPFEFHLDQSYHHFQQVNHPEKGDFPASHVLHSKLDQANKHRACCKGGDLGELPAF